MESYIHIPTAVTSCPRLTTGAKLLYGHIASLGRKEGCWATNAHLAQCMCMKERNIRVLLRELRDEGLIVLEHSSEKRARLIRPVLSAENPEDQMPDPQAKDCQGGGKEMPLPPAKDCHQNNKKNNKRNIKESDTAFRPVERIEHWVLEWGGQWPQTTRGDLREALMGFLDHREKIRNPMSSERALELLLSRLLEFSGGDPGMMTALLNTAVLNGWRTVYQPQRRDRTDTVKKVDNTEWL